MHIRFNLPSLLLAATLLLACSDDKSAPRADGGREATRRWSMRRWTPSFRDVPIALHSGVSANPACMLFGYSAPFSATKLRTLYPTHADYVSKVEASAKDAREKGFVLPEEETTIVAEATSAAVP